MGCAKCKTKSCNGTCGNEISAYTTSSLKYDGAKFVCVDSQDQVLFEIYPCMSANEVLELLFEKLCEGLQIANNSIVNIGTGNQWYAGLNGGVHQFRTFLTDPGFSLTQNPNDITLGINFISSDNSVNINVVGNNIDFVAVNQGGVINIGSGTGEVYAGLNGGNHEMRTLLQDKWTLIETIGSDVRIRGKRIGHRETTFETGSGADFFIIDEGDLSHAGQIAGTDNGSELSIIPLNEYLCLVTAYIDISVNMTSTDNGYLVFKMQLPDDIRLNTGGATQITNNYLQNNLSTCFYDMQVFDPNTDVPNRYDNNLIAEAIAFYDDGAEGNEIFPSGIISGNVLAIRYIPYSGVAGIYRMTTRVTIPVKLNSDWEYLESISPNYVRNW